MIRIIISAIESVETHVETQVVLPILPLLIMGWMIAIILLVLGVVRKKNKLTGTGICLIGIMTVVTPLTWYGYCAIEDNGVLMMFEDILILTFLAFTSGMIITFGIYTLLKQTKETT